MKPFEHFTLHGVEIEEVSFKEMEFEEIPMVLVPEKIRSEPLKVRTNIKKYLLDHYSEEDIKFYLALQVAKLIMDNTKMNVIRCAEKNKYELNLILEDLNLLEASSEKENNN